jgi:CO/xanthine dehydrogenase Mo-binding subunit
LTSKTGECDKALQAHRHASEASRRAGKGQRVAIYGIDVRLPGMKVATLAQSPVFGGRVKSVDDTAAKAVKGVRQIVRLVSDRPIFGWQECY